MADIRVADGEHDGIHSDQRSEPRIPLARNVRLNINPSLLAVDLDANTMPARILDFSRSGLHILVDSEIEDGDVVDIWVTLEDRPGDFLLHGHACWVKRDRKQRIHAGIVLEPAPGTAIDQWREMFDQNGELLRSAT